MGWMDGYCVQNPNRDRGHMSWQPAALFRRKGAGRRHRLGGIPIASQRSRLWGPMGLSAAREPQAHLSNQNPTPSQATRTEQENVWNSLNTFARRFARSHPYRMKTMPLAVRMRPPCPTVSEREGGRQAGMSSCCHSARTTKIRSDLFLSRPLPDEIETREEFINSFGMVPVLESN
ncbi:hypothetical protein Q8A73_021921 [Channa argus]|nr:hypothetical protein Q8A73_021921 [Channa argus]